MIICLRSCGHLRYELNSLKQSLHRRLEIKRPSLKRDYKRIFGTAVRISSPAYARVALYPVFVGYIIAGKQDPAMSMNSHCGNKVGQVSFFR